MVSVKKKIGDTSDAILNTIYFHYPAKLSNKVPIILCFK